MGLHDSLLNVPERLRVWQMAGVQYFYLSEPRPEATEQPAPESAVQDAGSPAPEPYAPLPDPVSWPKPWPGFLAKAPAHPRLVITYLELGYDLTGQADPRRGALWRRLITALGLSGQNAVAFWPLALPVDGRLVPELRLFLSGCLRLAPQRIAVFGRDAAALFDVGLRAALPAAVVACADPAVLVAGDEEAFAHAVSILAHA